LVSGAGVAAGVPTGCSMPASTDTQIGLLL
jgi:hypothetical protein